MDLYTSLAAVDRVIARVQKRRERLDAENKTRFDRLVAARHAQGKLTTEQQAALRRVADAAGA